MKLAGQIAALKDHYRCITFDFRGQGRSEVTALGYDMDTLTDDAIDPSRWRCRSVSGRSGDKEV